MITTPLLSVTPCFLPYILCNSLVPPFLHCVVVNTFSMTKFKLSVIEGLIQFMKSASSLTPVQLITIIVCDVAVALGYFTFSHVYLEFRGIVCGHMFLSIYE
jgi:hypothetical protein